MNIDDEGKRITETSASVYLLLSKTLAGPVSRRSQVVFTPGKPWQNLKPCDYRSVLSTYS